MDLKALDADLQEIIKKRMALQKIDYNNPKYDDVEEELHDAEDSFQDDFGDFLEEQFQDIHDEICPDTDVLHPIAYIAKTYIISNENAYSVASTEGVYVEADKYPGKDTKLALVPNPLRVILNIGKDNQIVVWEAEG
jgi:hypothetical protein